MILRFLFLLLPAVVSLQANCCSCHQVQTCCSDFTFYEDSPRIKPPYRLKIGDVLEISLYGEPDSLQQVIIDPKGNLNYLFIEPIRAAGKTIDQLRDELEKKLTAHFRFVTLSINPIYFGTDLYTVAGEVVAPGTFPVKGNPTILTGICQAGGFTIREYRDKLYDNVDLQHSFLIKQGEYVPIDFERLVLKGDLSQDASLEAGDYLYLMENHFKQVFVIGEVTAPLAVDYFMTRSMTLARAIAEAGGLTLFSSSRVVVVRGSLACPTYYLIDINRILKGYACDFVLEPGDIVYVPPRKFTRLREIFRNVVRSFVSVAASIAGTKAYLRSHPHALEQGDVVIPVPIIGGPEVIFEQ